MEWDPPAVTQDKMLSCGEKTGEVLYLQLLSDKSKRKMHVKADGTCNGTIDEENFSVTRISVFLKVAPRHTFHSSYLGMSRGRGQARPRF